jgi:hypothetical protein
LSAEEQNFLSFLICLLKSILCGEAWIPYNYHRARKYNFCHKKKGANAWVNKLIHMLVNSAAATKRGNNTHTQKPDSISLLLEYQREKITHQKDTYNCIIRWHKKKFVFHVLLLQHHYIYMDGFLTQLYYSLKKNGILHCKRQKSGAKKI